MSCPNLARCIFFNDRMAAKPAMAGILKKKYCEGEHHDCARWRVCERLGPEGTPKDLFPNQHDRLPALGVH
jgi:hypothetical protein